MADTPDQVLHDGLAVAVTLGLIAFALVWLLRGLGRSRPGLAAIGLPVAIAVGIRVIAAAGVSLTGIGSSLRGGDELGFVATSQAIADGAPGAISYGEALVTRLYEFVFAVQLAALDSPELALRATQAAIAVAGLMLLAVAVYELAGPRAAVITMWVLALEPTNVFFSTLLHKEANMILAGGLVAFGGAVLWKRGILTALAPITLGCLVAVATRPYAGWFLIAASAAIMLHAGIRQTTGGSVRGLSLLAAVVLLGAITAPTVFEASSDESLEQNLQGSQDANVADEGSNLNLETVDFSTRESIITNLPTRMRDVVFRPYPWQLDNPSQQLGLIGTLVVLGLLALLAREVVRNWGTLMARAGPLVYMAFFLLVAYSLSAGNAGTAFRYRMHVVAVALCVFVVLWWLRSRSTADATGPAAGARLNEATSFRETEPVIG